MSSAHPALVASFALEWLHNEQLAAPLLRYNQAHTLMLAEQGVMPRPIAALILRELRALSVDAPASIPFELARDGLQPCLEAELVRRLGRDVAGWLSTGRARQECELVARQILNRDKLLQLIGSALALSRAVQELAARHTGSLMPYHTWAQHAEPITLGYYLAAVAEALDADMSRLRSCYASMDRSRASCGQVVPPPLPIDRVQVAQWLGFQGMADNALYAYSSQDSELQVLSALASLMANVARLSANLYVWASDEFGFLGLAEDMSGTSYAMPQKRNPYGLRQLRPLSVGINAAWMEVVQLHGGALPMVGDGLVHAANRLLEWQPRVMLGLEALAQALAGLRVDHARMAAVCEDDWILASQLVYFLTGNKGLSFREAHGLMHELIRAEQAAGRRPGQLDPQAVVQAARLAGLTPQAVARVTVSTDELREVLDPMRQVASRHAGGPNPNSVQAHLQALAERQGAHTQWHAEQQAHLAAAGGRLDAAIDILLGPPPQAPHGKQMA